MRGYGVLNVGRCLSLTISAPARIMHDACKACGMTSSSEGGEIEAGHHSLRVSFRNGSVQSITLSVLLTKQSLIAI